jgi:hypothetical protein
MFKYSILCQSLILAFAYWEYIFIVNRDLKVLDSTEGRIQPQMVFCQFPRMSQNITCSVFLALDLSNVAIKAVP